MPGQEGLARGRGEKLGWVGEREKREKIFFLMKEEVGWIFFFFLLQCTAIDGCAL